MHQKQPPGPSRKKYENLTDQQRLELISKELDEAISTTPKGKELGKYAVEIYSELTRLKRSRDEGTADGTLDGEMFKEVASKLYHEAFGIQSPPNE